MRMLRHLLVVCFLLVFTAEAGAAQRGIRTVSQQPELGAVRTALRKASEQYARRIAVTIGNDAYAGPTPALDAAVADARRMARLFRELGFEQVESLENATRSATLDLLERRVPSASGPSDLVVVFFAGHGDSQGEQGYVLPVDFAGNHATQAISVQQLKETALRMKAKHVLFLVDACFSGAMFKRGPAPSAENVLAFWEAAGKEQVVQILSAGRANELVIEKDGWGMFTRAVHAGLLGDADADKNAVTTVAELAAFVEARVVKESQGKQHPQWGNIDGSGMVLLWDGRRLPKASPVTRGVVSGLEGALAEVHRMISAKAWREAEERLRQLALKHDALELNLLLAEVYLGADPLGNSSLIEAELRRVAGASPTAVEEQRMLELKARLEQTKRGPF